MPYFLPRAPGLVASAVVSRKNVDGLRGKMLAVWSAEGEGRLRTRLRHELVKTRDEIIEMPAPKGGVVMVVPESFASESLWAGITSTPLVKDGQTIAEGDTARLARASSAFFEQSGFREKEPEVIGRNRFGFNVTDRTFGRTAERTGRDHKIFSEWGFTEGARNLTRAPDMFYRAVDDGSLLNNARSVLRRMDQGEVFSESQIKALAERMSTAQLTVTSRALMEAVEAQVSRSIVSGELNTRQAIEQVMLAFPRSRERTGNTIALQQYSTPFPFGDAASNIFGGFSGQTVLDPTIGNGALVASMASAGAEITGIELDRGRMLRASYAMGENATIHHGAFDEHKGSLPEFDMVFVNPPFGQLDKSVTIPDRGHSFPTKALHYQIAVEALQKLKVGGSAFIVLPADIYNPEEAGKSSERFGNWLRLGFDDVQEAVCDSRLYRGMGADVPVQIYAAKGFRSELKPFDQLATIRADSTYRLLHSFDDLYDWSFATAARFNADVATPQTPVEESSAPPPKGDTPTDQGVASPNTPSDPPAPTTPRRDEPETFEGVADSGMRASAGIGDDVVPMWLTEGTISDDTQRYQPFSTSGTSKTVIPKSLSGATYDALRQLEEGLGENEDGSKQTVDDYVADLLGTTVDDLEASQILSPEQIDAVALLHHTTSQGRGALLGDLMGVGKGRTLAALAEIQLRSGGPVLFTTITPSLFTDFVMRDLQDVSRRSSEERLASGDIRPHLVNSGAVLQNHKTGATIYKQPANKKSAEGAFGIDPSANLVATSYSQFQTRDGATRLKAVKDWIDHHLSNGHKPLVLLDESHNAASPTSNTGAIFQELIRYAERAGGAVIRSSATGIKTGEHIELYYSCLPDTGLGKLELLDVMANSADLSLQEALAHEMAANGSMIVRQLSSAGIGRELPRLVDFDREKIVGIRAKVDRSSALLREIIEQMPLISQAANAIAKQSLGGDVSSKSAKDKFRLNTNSPVSNLHHYSGYLTLGVKGQFLDDLITDSVARGEKPVVVVEHVGTSVLQWKLSQPGVLKTDGTGDYLEEPPHLGDVLKRYVDRALEAKATNALGASVTIDLRDMFEGWRNAMFEQIDAADFTQFRVDGPDMVKAVCDRLEMSCGEISGRTKGTGNRGVGGKVDGRYALYELEGSTNSAVNQDTARQFNNGDLDVLVINRSASTGISLHASPANGDDCRRRGMIKLEIQADIVQERQIDGRVDRNGQVEPPRYITPLTGLASDDRLTSLFNRKNRSLSASTNATRENDKTIDEVVDLLNEVGQQVVVDYLKRNPFLAQTLDIDVAEETSGGAVTRKLMGRLICLPLDEQQSVLGEIDVTYKMRLEYLDARGLNPLKNNKYDWRGKIVSDEIILHENRADGIASQPVRLAVIEAPTAVEPLSFETAMKEAGRGLATRMNLSSGTQPSERLRKAFKDSDDSGYSYADPDLNSQAFQKAIKRLDKSLFEGGAGLDVVKRTEEIQQFFDKDRTRYEALKEDPKKLALYEMFENAETLRQFTKVVNIGGAIGINVELVPELRDTRLAKALSAAGAPQCVPAIVTDCYSSSAYPLDPDYWSVSVAILGESETKTLPLGNVIRSIRDDEDPGRWARKLPFHSFNDWVAVMNVSPEAKDTLKAWLAYDGRSGGIFDSYERAQQERRGSGTPQDSNAPLTQREDQKELLRNLFSRTVAGTVMEQKHVMMGNMFRALVLAQEGQRKVAGQKIMFSTEDGMWHHGIEIEGGAKNAQVAKIRDKGLIAAISSPAVATAENISAMTKLVLSKHSASVHCDYRTSDRELVDSLYAPVRDKPLSAHIAEHKFQPFTAGIKPVSAVFIGPDIFSTALLQPERIDQKTYTGLNKRAGISTSLVSPSSAQGTLFNGYHTDKSAINSALGAVQRDFKKGEMYYFTAGTSSCLVFDPKNAFLQEHYPDLVERATNKQFRINHDEYTLRGGMVTIGLNWYSATDATHATHERICEAIAAYGRASDQLPLLSGAFRDLTENLGRFSLGLQREAALSLNINSDFARDVERDRPVQTTTHREFSL